MTVRDRAIKRAFDISTSCLGLLLLWPVILATWYLARRDTGASGFFVQNRVGQYGRIFRLVKLRTMHPVDGTSVTVWNDSRITPLGARFRRWKLDELPQLWNVVKGDMSLVGPRPDMSGFADGLQGDDRVILEMRPGITGPATLKYRDEELMLAEVADPQAYNTDVIWPDKVRINRDYWENWSLRGDIAILFETIFR